MRILKMLHRLPLFLYIFAFVLTGLLLAACGGTGAPVQPTPAAKPTVPTEYAGRSNPFGGEAAAIEAGGALYATHCSACHGAEGQGDGPAAPSLNPKPMPLAQEMGSVSDDYLYWRIAEGGAMAPFHSAMPAWKTILTEEQIWQVIAYMRTFK